MRACITCDRVGTPACSVSSTDRSRRGPARHGTVGKRRNHVHTSSKAHLVRVHAHCSLAGFCACVRACMRIVRESLARQSRIFCCARV